jgi:hypothetical protein
MNLQWTVLANKCWDERTDGLHFDQEMFAELIIRKCIEIDVDNPDAAPGVEIAKYFGLNDDSNI